MTETCKQCGQRTEYMYRLNEGLYCDDHKEAALIQQQQAVGMDALRDRLIAFRRPFTNFDLITY